MTFWLLLAVLELLSLRSSSERMNGSISFDAALPKIPLNDIHVDASNRLLATTDSLLACEMLDHVDGPSTHYVRK